MKAAAGWKEKASGGVCRFHRLTVSGFASRTRSKAGRRSENGAIRPSAGSLRFCCPKDDGFLQDRLQFGGTVIRMTEERYAELEY